MKLDIVKHKFIYLAISAILLIPGIIAMIYSMITYDTHTPVKVGIDYTGGTTLHYGVEEAVGNDKLASVREALENNGIEKPVLQIINVNSKENTDMKTILSIRTKFIDETSGEADEITSVVQQQYKDAELIQVSSVGATLGNELFKMSLVALALAIIGMIIYISFTFKFEYALAAILGLVHDV